MTLEEFEAEVDLHGTCIADWPASQQQAAAGILAQSAEARAVLAAAEEVATLLALTRTAPMTTPERIVAVATAQAQQRPRAPPFRVSRAVWRYAACVAVALTGFALGLQDGLHRAVPFERMLATAFGPAGPFDAF